MKQNEQKKSKKRTKSSRSVIKLILHDVGSMKSTIVFVVVLMVIAKIALALAPKFSGKITDYLASEATSGSIDMSWVVSRCAVLLVMYFIGYGVDGIVNKKMVYVGENLVRDLRNRAEKKMNMMKLNYIDTHSSGDILSRVTNDLIVLANSLESTVSGLLGQLILLIGLIFAMFFTDWRLAIIYIIILPIGFFLTATIMKKTGKLFKAQNDLIGELNGHISDTYSNHLLMKAYGCEEKRQEYFDEQNKNFYDIYVKSRFLSGFVIPLSTMVNNVTYIVLCIIGGILLLKGKLTIGEFQAFIFYGNMISSPLSALSTSMNNLQNGISSAERVYDFFEEEEEDIQTSTETIELSDVKGCVEFKNVKFGYLKDHMLMKDVSLTAKPGTTIAVVGPSGAGKTTLINLLMRFYEINDGHIYLDGKDTRNLSRQNLRSAFGMVLQDTWIFNGTIAENISYGKKDATREEIIEAARKVRCDTFIDKLPDGYDTYISEENSALSLGEKQLLSIARTVLADPKILILDEATSQVDTKTEYLITQAMDNMMKNRTSFMIAHRLFTIRNADCIIYMENGDIKEVGNHEELMSQNGRYAELYREASS